MVSTFGELICELRLKIKGDEMLSSCEEALHQAYRILLGRMPDAIGHQLFSTMDYPVAVRTVVDIVLLSPEFLQGWVGHLGRLREDKPSPVTWHVHLPRTGGTKFAKDWLHADGFVFAAPLRSMVGANPGDASSVLEQLAAFQTALMSDRPVLVSGHVTLSDISPGLRPTDSVVVTTRHPIDRALSLYRYAKALAEGGSGIIGYPDDRELPHFTKGWKERLASHELTVASTMNEFIESAICEDGELDRYLTLQGSCPADLGAYLRDIRVTVIDQADLRDGPLINSTGDCGADSHDHDVIAAWFADDIRRYNQIRLVFEPNGMVDLSLADDDRRDRLP